MKTADNSQTTKSPSNSCPRCKTSWDGGSIWQHFFDDFTKGRGYWKDVEGNYTEEKRLLDEGEAESITDEVASHYGATRTSGNWGRQISIICPDKDRQIGIKCPDCDYDSSLKE